MKGFAVSSITDSPRAVNGVATKPTSPTTEEPMSKHQTFVEATLARWRAEDAERRAAEARGERVRIVRTEIVEEL